MNSNCNRNWISLNQLGIIFVALGLVGCATPMPPLEFTPHEVNASPKKQNAELKTISISVAQEGEKFGETLVGFGGNEYEQSFKATFKSALEESLARAAIFNDLSSRKISLSAKILKFETPGVSSSFETEMIVRYQLIDRATGEVIYSKNISALGSVPFSYAFVGAIRFTEARNISVRENIKHLIANLEDADLSVSLTPEQLKIAELEGKPIIKKLLPNQGRSSIRQR